MLDILLSSTKVNAPRPVLNGLWSQERGRCVNTLTLEGNARTVPRDTHTEEVVCRPLVGVTAFLVSFSLGTEASSLMEGMGVLLRAFKPFVWHSTDYQEFQNNTR